MFDDSSLTLPASSCRGPAPRHQQAQADYRDNQRDEPYVYNFKPHSEILDLLIQAALDLSELLANPQTFILKAIQFRLLLRCQNHCAAIFPAGLQFPELGLGFLQLLLQLLLLQQSYLQHHH